MSRALLLTVALSVVSCCSATAPLRMAADGEQKQQKQHQPLAFANSFLPSAAAGVAACSFAGDRSSVVPGASIDELASSMSGGWSMSCRRNLKKEKRARNEHMARQFRKPAVRGRGRGGGGRGRGGGRAEAERKSEADGEWLSQIYGQHTIYRRDNTAMGAAPSTEAPSMKESAVREPVAA